MTSDSSEEMWKNLPARLRREIVEENDIEGISSLSFYEALELSENEWVDHAVSLYNTGADLDAAIAISAIGCQLRRQILYTFLMFDRLNGHECDGSHRIIKELEASKRAIKGLVEEHTSDTIKKLRFVWENRFRDKVLRHLDKI
jgi:hypothetical protein